MSLFGKKKEENARIQDDKNRDDKNKDNKNKEDGTKVDGIKKESGCCCGGNCNADSVQAAKETLSSGANVKVLGSGCNKCNALEQNVKEALRELGMNDEVDHVTDFGQIAAMGVMSTPALMIDNKVVSMGKVLSKEEAVKALHKVRGNG